jgi:hypothetical protein
MKILVLVAGLLPYVMGMLSLRRAPTHRYNARSLCTTSLVQFDPAWQITQLVRPHLRRLNRPIASATQASSWYHETDGSSGAALYLIEYGKYYGPMLNLRAFYLVNLSNALRQTDQEDALKRWVAGASILTMESGLPRKPIQLLQVQYLDLLLFAKKLSGEDERLALASYIDENIPRLVQAHRQEVYQLFIDGHLAAVNKKKFLEALPLPFIHAQLIFGIDQVLEEIERKVPEVDMENFCKLRTMAIRESKGVLANPTETSAELEHRLFLEEALRQPDLAQRDALIKSGKLYLQFALEMDEIVKYLRGPDQTLGHNNDIGVIE